MAITKKTAAKPATPVKPASGSAKTAKPVKAMANKQAPEKTAAKKPTPVSKTAAPAKKEVVVKAAPKAVSGKAAATPAAKPTAKQAASTPAPGKKNSSNTDKANNQKIVTKKNTTPVTPAPKNAPAKKTAPAAKAAPDKKAAPAKKAVAAPVVTKAATKPATKTPEKTVAKAPAKPAPKASPAPAPKPAPAKPVPAPKAVTPPPAPKPVPVKAATSHADKKLPVKKKLTVTQMPVKINPAAPKPMATPAARNIEKKPNVIIAHRRMENKSKIPKEAENTMIQYQPETYRSILDEPVQSQGPVYRYSDEDLAEFREIITSRLEAARKELNYLQGLITRKDEAGTEDTENRYMNMEDGSGAMEREQLAQLASRQIQFMSHLEKALVRIENKTYGICRVTGKLIDKARLRAVPHATLSIEAKKLMASKQN